MNYKRFVATIRTLSVTLCALFISAQMQSAAVLQSSSARRVSKPPAEAAVPFRVGEVLTYDVSWSNTLSAGTATLSVRDKLSLPGNQTAYDLFAEAKPGFVIQKLYPIYYKLEAYLDTKSLLPIRATMYSEERSRKRTKTARFVSPTSIEYEYTTASVSRSTKQIERMARDPLSAFYVIRGMPLAPGQSLTIPLVEGGTMYRLTVKAGSYETISTKAGPYRALRLTPTLSSPDGKPVTGRALTLWISDGPKHLPVRFEASLLVGTFVLNLTQAQ